MVQLSRNEKVVACCLTGLVFFILLMDMKLYRILQSTTIVKEKDVVVEHWSPFHPLSIKLLISDHYTHYIITPLSEYFNSFTHFSEVFFFITPNMISITHFAIGLTSAKLVTSESLNRRRLACLLYELRTWLDSLDGTVYRARAKNKLFVSNHSQLGFWVDSIADTVAGFALMFGVMFYLWWHWVPRKDADLPVSYKSGLKNGVKNGLKNGLAENGIAVEYHTEANGKPGRLYLFWVCFCYGIVLMLGSGCWDQIVMKYDIIFETKMSDSALEAVQTEAFHSGATCFIFWMWRFCQCQAFLHYILFAIVIDKIWEFLRLVQYPCIALMLCLVVATLCHIRHLRQLLGV